MQVNQLTLLASLHGTNNAAPSIHNTLAQGDDVIVHLVGTLRGSSDGRSLLEDLGHNGQVGLKVATDGTSNVAEALQNSRLELVGQSSALLTR